jgi:glycosyltransferase
MVSAKDQGIYHAMNKGLGLATGEVIGILNSDDLYTSNSVLTLVAKVFEDESVDGCYADLQYVNASQLDKISRTWKSGEFTPRSFYWGWMPPHPTVFLRKRVYDAVGNFNLSLRSAADYEFLLRVFVKNNFKFKYIPVTLVKMRTGGMSNASLRNRFRANREDRMAWELNGLKPYFFTLYLKPVRKIFQFLIK